MGARAVGDEHGGQHGGAAGEDEAVERDDERGALEVLQLGILDLAIDLGERLLTAHGENGVAEGHEDAEESEEMDEWSALEEAEGVVTELQIGGGGEWRQLGMLHDGRINAPAEDDDNHDGCDLHDLEGLVAGLLDALDVFPPVVDGDDGGKEGRGFIDGEVEVGLAV